MRIRLIYILLISSLTVSLPARAQVETVVGASEGPVADDCLTTLSNAENEFGAGRFYGIPSLLKNCIDQNQFSDEEKVRVYMLLTQVYLLTDEPASADESYLKLLAADPEFVASELNDPIDVVFLSKKFTTTPIFTPHFKGGVNGTNQVILRELNTFSTPVRTVHTRLPGISVGAGLEWNINDNLGIGGEALYSRNSFKTSVTGIHIDDNQIVTERQSWIDIPFYVRYGDHLGKFRPYGYAGYAINLLLGASVDREYTDLFSNDESGTGNQSPVQGAPRQDIRYKRNLINQSILVGGGIKYKVRKDFILIDVRYAAGLTNVANAERNYYDAKDGYDLNNSISQYSYIGNLFRVNAISFTIGYVRPLYDPRRIKKANTKSVSRRIAKTKSK